MRSLLLRTLFAGVVVGVPLVACGFPDISFENAAAVADAAASATTASETPVPVVDVSTKDAAPDVAEVDASTKDVDVSTNDASSEVDASTNDAGADAGPAPVCDEDHDGVLRGGPACVPADGAQADCDDTDARIYPGADFQSVAWPNVSPHLPANDWNCDGAVTKELPSGITCASLGDCTEGFATDIACGATATYNVCKKVVPLLGAVLCMVDHTETRTQGCH